MCRENYLFADFVGVIVPKLAHKLKREESCVALVKVERVNVHVA